MDLRQRIAGGLVLDGGLATELERRGQDLSDELWSARLLVDDPDAIRAVHEAYFEAGADVAITASYQASFDGFERRGLARDVTARLLRRSVDLARRAAEPRAGLVAASVGPFGATRADGSEYVGRYGLRVEQLEAFHRPRMETLLDAEPDLLAVETIPAIEEIEALVGVLDDVEHPAWISFSCRDAEHVSDGTPITDAVTTATACPHVVAVGVNCTPPTYVPDLLRAARTATDLPLVAYPNVGSTWDARARAWRIEGARPDMAAASRTWREAGATLVGGCCGTTPDDIAAIATTG